MSSLYLFERILGQCARETAEQPRAVVSMLQLQVPTESHLQPNQVHIHESQILTSAAKLLKDHLNGHGFCMGPEAGMMVSQVPGERIAFAKGLGEQRACRAQVCQNGLIA